MTEKRRTYNFYAKNPRKKESVTLHPDLVEGLKEVARVEGKSMSWVIETALADFFGVALNLRECKTTRPE